MDILTFTTLFPNRAHPTNGIFVETRLRHLVASGKVRSRVVAPVPWFPFRHARFGRYAKFAQAPRADRRFGYDIVHPRYPVVPKLGMTAAPFLLANAVKPVIGRIIDEGYDFDVIDAHYFYPDGVAAAMLGRYFNKPVVITARGTDISFIPQYRLPRKMIRWAVDHADCAIAVCDALRQELIALGADAGRVVTLRNGVDLQLFRPVDRDQARRELQLEHFTLLSVGNLVSHKGHDLVIGALTELPDVRLLIAGAGPEQATLKALAERLGVSDRVRFLGTLPQERLKACYGAADALVLASSREGWANVLLESMACGTPVVASKVWGTPEVVASPAAGILMEERSARGVAQSVAALRACYPDRAATRRYAEQFSWDATTRGQIDVFRRLRRKRP
ncbi:glycosyltransferase family 4 protein [Noviherbaspirillum massiliense]|uniref:glycosyltransferase family 4 protein n=1 Tax=Noviherbaspirillum massiliense TaxID=1465823 RepID=UPI000313207A|nr:glycosyltransferase family 4 protein [Noviherbaspirillum massiliense]